MKKLTIVFGCVLLSAFLVGCGGSQSSQQSQPVTPPPTTTPTYYKVGETATVPGVVEATVTRVQHLPLSQTEPGWTPTDTKPGDVFLVVSVTMTNLGSAPLQVTGFDYKMQDAQGNKPEMWIDGVQGTQELATGTALPGMKMKGDVTYIVPAQGGPYYFLFTPNTPAPLVWQVQ